MAFDVIFVRSFIRERPQNISLVWAVIDAHVLNIYVQYYIDCGYSLIGTRN